MNQILVTTSRGLDELLKSEIESLCLDVSCRLSPGTVSFSGTLEQAYTLCLWSRLANRVVWVLAEGPCDSADELYDTASSVDWQQHLRPSNTLSVQFNGTNRAIKNSQFGAVRIKDAIVDQFMEELDLRPSVEKKLADFPIWARCHREKVTIGLDLSGNSLHQRAYRSVDIYAGSCLHIKLRGRLFRRVGGNRDLRRPREAAVLQRLEHQIERHHLGQRGGIARLVRGNRIENLAVLGVYHDRRIFRRFGLRRGNLERIRRGTGRQQSGDENKLQDAEKRTAKAENGAQDALHRRCRLITARHG